MKYVILDLENSEYRSLFNKDTITLQEILEKYDELKSDYDYLNEEYENYKQCVKDNYKMISPSEMYCISDRDFI